MRFGERRNVKEIADLHWSSREAQFHAPGPAVLLKAEHSNEVAMIDKERERSEIEALLPWHAAGILSRREADLLERALAGDSELVRRYDVVRRELAETIRLNKTLGAPSAHAMEKLFAAIDAKETGAPRRGRRSISRTPSLATASSWRARL
jgi:hypothetical protein